MELNKWDKRFMQLAETVAEWSKGPRTKVGAVLTRPNRTIASTGFNGPPAGFEDSIFANLMREAQHDIVIHAEINALNQISGMEFFKLKPGHTLYVTHCPCLDCAKTIVKSGVSRVVYGAGKISAEWQSSLQAGRELLEKRGVTVVEVRP